MNTLFYIASGLSAVITAVFGATLYVAGYMLGVLWKFLCWIRKEAF